MKDTISLANLDSSRCDSFGSYDQYPYFALERQSPNQFCCGHNRIWECL
jgi:hypothetical protein